MSQKQLSEKALQMRRLLTPDEAAQYIGGITPAVMAKWRSTGGGPKFIRISSNPRSVRADVRYDLEDLNNWLDERRFSSTSDAA